MQNAAVHAARVRPPFFILVKGDGRPLGPQKKALYLKFNFFFFMLRVSEALLRAVLVNGPSPAISFSIFFLPYEYENTTINSYN